MRILVPFREGGGWLGVQEIWGGRGGLGGWGGGGTLTETSFHIRPFVPRVTPAPNPGLFGDQAIPVIAVFAATFVGHAHCPSTTREASRTQVKSISRQRTAIAPLLALLLHSEKNEKGMSGVEGGGGGGIIISCFCVSHPLKFLFFFLFYY